MLLVLLSFGPQQSLYFFFGFFGQLHLSRFLYFNASHCRFDYPKREVQEERGWFSFLHGWCVHVSDRLAYLNAIIHELELCSNHMSVARLLVELRSGDSIVFADAIMYFKAIRDFEAEKLANLHLFLEASAAHLGRRRQFAARFNTM
ncbi:hypothetical protein CTI12_AA618430 [Artemisia annua]|uniref:Uncharacterized protein n=1 Tax=Artemisia annua TaxID=35608 RepID=A0A2U1KCL5_ARTAN|nr:hypothetical protein CTI12_AA618430 [Artemisia annua]